MEREELETIAADLPPEAVGEGLEAVQRQMAALGVHLQQAVRYMEAVEVSETMEPLHAGQVAQSVLCGPALLGHSHQHAQEHPNGALHSNS